MWLQGFWHDFRFWFVFRINAPSWGWRARGRPKTTLRRTIKKERNKARWKSWGVAKAVAQDEESVGQKGWWPYVLTGSIRHEEKSRKRGLHSTHWYFWNTTSGQSGMPFVLPAAKWSSKNSHGVECRLFFPLLPPSACPTLPLSFSGVTTVLPSHGCISYLTNHKEKNTPKLQ